MKYIKHPWFFLVLSFIVTVMVKIPHLGLPYFWDEAFSYIPAVTEMAKTGPSMLPGSISMFLAKGHPLFFYFLASCWMKFIAKDSIFLMHLFPLLVSLVALFVFHRFAKRHTNIILANVAVVLLSLQSLFLAQSSLVLPEVLLFVLLILSFDSYLSTNYVLYALWVSLAMLTKETSAIFVLVFGSAYLVENYRTWKTKIFWRNLALFSAPVIVYMIFLILHYSKFGVFFFSDHLGYISFDRAEIIRKFNSSTFMLFLAQGRNLIFFSALLSLIVLVFRRININYRRFQIISLLILIFYLIFSVLNFFTYRYVFPVFGIVLLSMLSLVQQLSVKKQTLNIIYIACIFSVSVYYSITYRTKSDSDLGYTEFLLVHQEMARYCEHQDWDNKNIGAGTNMSMALRSEKPNYLITDKHFKMHQLPGINGCDIVIYDSTSEPFQMPENEKIQLTLVKSFNYKQHWGKIYTTPTFKK